MLCEGGLERYAVTNQEMQSLEPSLRGSYYGGFYCPGDATGDIHKFTMGLAETTQRLGVKYLFGMDASAIHLNEQGVRVLLKPSDENMEKPANTIEILNADALVICGGVGSYHLAEMLGDRVNIYPVKGYSITVELKDRTSQQHAPWVSLLDESAKIVSSRLGIDRLRVAGTAEFNGYNRDIRSDRIQPLIDWLHRNFDLSTEFAIPWAGLRPMMPNMMPIVNRGKRERVFYNTGHGHLGWTLSAATAVMISQQIAQSHPI